MSRVSWSWALVLPLLLGCAAQRERLLANSAEYERYRQTRVAPTLEGRLQAAWRYLKEYPEGEFRREVQGWFQPVEADYFLVARASRVRLREYLEALPDGPHAADARARIVELERGQGVEQRQEQRALQRVRRVTARLEAAESSRKAFLRAVADWVGWLANIRTWGGRTHELDHELIHAYRVEAPVAQCGATTCVKQLSFSYSIPEMRKLAERVAVFDVVLTLREGGVIRAELTGPDLFSRIGEAAQRAPVAAGDAQRRAEAIGATRQLLAGVLESSLAGPQCSKEAVSPVILARGCQGTSLRVIAALTDGGEDRVVVEAATSAE